MVEEILARLVAFPSVVGTPSAPIPEWFADDCGCHGAIICGPRDIARAHRRDEYITRGELDECRMMISLGERLCA